MPQNYSKFDVLPVKAGDLITLVKVFQPAIGVDSEGGVLRSPSGTGGPADSALLANPLWSDYAAVESYGAQARNVAGQLTGEVWKALTVRFHPKKKYRQGQLIQVMWSREYFEIQDLELVMEDWRKYVLTCRRVGPGVSG